MPVNVMIVGVGGQGSLLASKLLGSVAEKAGHSVKVSEVHGMSQRGGSVVTYVRYGADVYSPVIKQGEADYIISFEKLEAARWLPMLKPGGTIITSEIELMPATVLRGDAQYPEALLDKLAAKGVRVVAIKAEQLAQQAGFARAANTVIMGAFAQKADFEPELWEQALAENVKPTFLEINRAAFMLGYNNAGE